MATTCAQAKLFAATGLATALFMQSCQDSIVACDEGGGSKLSNGECVEATPDDRADQLVNAGRPLEAVAILEDLVQNEPQNYERYSRLASAYAIAGNLPLSGFIDLLSVPGSEPLALVQQIIPERNGREVAFEADLSNVQKAIDRLNAIPAGVLNDTTIAASNSARFQLRIYQSAISFMLLRRYESLPLPGASERDGGEPFADFEREDLEQITDDDVDAILSNLEGAAAVAGADATDAAVQATIQETLVALETEPGETNREKLINFFSKDEDQAPEAL